jgi:glycosyltransferase involved in cell wall biosynthesis
VKILLTANVRWWNAEAAYAWEKAHGLHQLGHEVTFLGIPGTPFIARAEKEGFPVFATADLNSLNPLSWPGAVSRLRSFLRRENFDVVDAHRSEGFAILVAACRGSGAILVRTRGDMRRPRRDPVNRLIHVYGCHGLAASGRVVAEKMADAFNVPVSSVEVMYYGVDAVHFSPGERESLRREWGVQPGEFLTGMVGRVDRVKGLGNFLQAAAKAGRSRPGAKFLVAVKEDHPDLPTYRDMIGMLGMSDRIVVLGFRKDIERVYRALDAAVVASLGSEANCRVTLEAMATGLPVVATRAGVIPEVVEDGVCGYLVPAGEVAPLVESMEDFIDNPELARRMGMAARLKVEERFTRQVLAAKAEHYYRRIREERGGRKG